MLRYIVHRLLMMLPTLVAISLLVFVIIQLPEGDYLTTYITELEALRAAPPGLRHQPPAWRQQKRDGEKGE